MKKRGVIYLFIFLFVLGSNLIYFGARAVMAKDVQKLYQKNSEQLVEVNDRFDVLFGD